MSKEMSSKLVILVFIIPVAIAAVWTASCNNSAAPPANAMTGTITTSLTDPPTCGASFDHVWVTVTKATAHISSTAGPTDNGWVTLVDLTSAPKQIDLLSLASTTCLLTQLGSTSGLPPGKYQQIRLYLLDNSASSGPSPNACGSGNGFNCVVPTGGSPQELLLSSEAQTGLKIPPGQIAGGGINLTAGQSADLNINFDACESIHRQGNGKYRLKPTLHAGEVSVNNNSISGKVVDSSNTSPIPGAIILLEQPDSNAIDRIVDAGISAADGTFIFCPLASGNYDVVVAAAPATALVTTTVYNATIAFQVPAGTSLNNIPLVSEGFGTAPAIPWATLTGQVTSVGTGGATAADITFSALQDATPTGGSVVHVTIPVFSANAQPPTFETTATPTPATPACPMATDCLNYSLVVPASNLSVGTFASGAITYAAPASGTVNYSLLAESADCTASAPSPALVTPIAVTPATTTTVSTIPAFSGCTAPM